MRTYIRDDIYKKLTILARHRGVTIQTLILQFLETVTDEEQNEVGFEQIVKH